MFRVLPFGLQNAPMVFSRLMNTVLEGLPFATSYIDDIIIWSDSPEEHAQHVQTVFDRLREHCLKLKLRKCEFFQPQTT